MMRPVRKESRRGGARPGAGRPTSWKTPGPTTTIRVPVVLAPRVADLARQLDAHEPLFYDADQNAKLVREALAQLRGELAWLDEDRKRQPRRSLIRAAARILEHYQTRD